MINFKKIFFKDNKNLVSKQNSILRISFIYLFIYLFLFCLNYSVSTKYYYLILKVNPAVNIKTCTGIIYFAQRIECLAITQKNMTTKRTLFML